jgi:hypothetical protein
MIPGIEFWKRWARSPFYSACIVYCDFCSFFPKFFSDVFRVLQLFIQLLRIFSISVLRKCYRYEKNTGIFESFLFFRKLFLWKYQEKQKNNYSLTSKPFSGVCGFGSASIRKSAKIFQNDQLDVKKLDDTAENGPLQTSKIRKIWVYWCDSNWRPCMWDGHTDFLGTVTVCSWFWCSAEHIVQYSRDGRLNWEV